MPENGGTNGSSGAKRDHGEHSYLFHFVYVLGYSVLSLAADFTFIWPESHLNGLLFLAAAFSLLSVYEFRNSKKGWRIGIPIFLFVFAFIANWIIGPIQVPEVEVIGSLQPGNDPTPPIPCNPRPPDTALKIFIGKNVAFQRDATIKKLIAIRVGSCPVATMEQTAAGIAVTASMYNSSGKLIVRIADGVMHIMTNGITRATRNGDLSTLIVTDDSRNELLYIRYLNPTTLRIKGTFGCPGHALVQITDDKVIRLDGGSLRFTDGVCFAPNEGTAGLIIP